MSFIALIKTLMPLLIEFIRLKSNKEIKIKAKEYEVHIKDESDIDKAIKALEMLKQSDDENKIIS